MWDTTKKRDWARIEINQNWFSSSYIDIDDSHQPQVSNRNGTTRQNVDVGA